MQFSSRFGFQVEHAPCDAAAIQGWAASLPDGKLPPDYVTFLLQWNGGYFPDWIAVPFQDGDEIDDGCVKKFYGLFDPENQLDLRNVSTSYGFRTGVPANYVVIGGNGLWDLLCISVAGPDFGHVYVWQPGEPWQDETPTTQFLRPVAQSFAEFWNLMFQDQ